MIDYFSAGLPLTVNGDGLLQDVHRSGFYSIRYGFGVPFQGTLTTILDTDYEDYAVVYSCTNSLLSGVFHSEYIWVLSRSGKISNPTRQNIYEKLDKLGINRSGLTMSDRSTCPTNSSTVARESDKDLAGVQVPVSGAAASGAAPAAGAADQSAVAGGQSPVSSPVASLEKAGVAEPTQKSVVTPLLYDLPSPVSSSSVGGPKAGASKAPPSPVDNKVPQLPVSSSVPTKPLASMPAAVVAAPVPLKPVVTSLSSSASSSSSSSSSQPIVQSAPISQQSSQSPAQPQQQQSSASSAIAPKSSSQQPQQQSLMAKIQQKP